MLNRRRSAGATPALAILLAGLVWCRGAEAAAVPSLCGIHHPSDAKVGFQCYRVRRGETLEKLFGKRWKDVARFNRTDRRHVYPGIVIKVPGNLEEIRDFTPLATSYPPAEQEAKFILVDLSEQFLGAYEYGRLVFSAPIATGESGNETPAGEFRISAAHGRHVSSLYSVESTDKPYPMHFALRFHVSRGGVEYWIHGRDLPGYPASHGCIGLYDEEMQRRYYGYPGAPQLDAARELFTWAMGPRAADRSFQVIEDGPRVLIGGRAPGVAAPRVPP